VIACHYDSLEKPEGFVGATDSAVPCAMMLNMAKTMRNEFELMKRKEPNLTIQFIFFDGEEAFVKWSKTDSIYGSRNLARSWEGTEYRGQGVTGTELDRIDIFVLLDLIGAGNMQFYKLETSTGEWYDRLPVIEKNLVRKGLMSKSSMFQERFFPAGIEDDHIPFKQRGVPILHLIAYPFPKEWHKIGDNKSSLSFKKIENFNKILRVFVAEYLHIVDL
jgi:glutaminyl-peptide cyclotransferase